jgi:polygalacturonase
MFDPGSAGCGIYDIQRFGAVGDGKTKATSAVQQAIDDCHEMGGGTVLVPPGIYLIGTIYLKSSVTLHLSAGAVLRGSSHREDYNPDDVFPENQVFSRENVTGAHLVIAYQAENVSITGEGTIDGNSSQFFEPLPPDEITTSYQYRPQHFTVAEWRPGQMVFFCRCTNVSVRDISLVNAPYWTVFLLGCRGVQVRGLRITNPPQTPTCDGIDIDCCRDVTVSDCIIHTGDDAITLRGNNSRLGEHGQACQNVAITNCVLSTPCCGFRVGVGSGVVRDCTISNIVIKETRTGINVISAWSERLHGVAIENVRFANISMDVIVPLNVLLGQHARPPAQIRDLSFAHIRAIGRQGCYLGGNPGQPIADIHLHDVELVLTGDEVDPDFAHKIPGAAGTNGVPAALWARYIEGLRVSGLRVAWREISGAWQHGVVIENSSAVGLAGLEVTPPPTAPEGEALHCSDVKMLKTS